MPARAIWRTILVGLIASVSPGCHKGPANASPTVVVSKSPDGVMVAGVTAAVLTATASDANGDALTFTWDLGDGQTASGASVVHVYAREGVLPVALTVSDSRGGVTMVGTSITVGTLGGRWLLSEGGGKFYERGFDIVQAGPELGGRPFSEPDKGCLGDLHGHMTSPRTLRFEFQACDGNVVVIDGTATSDLLQIPATYTHPDGPPQPMVLTRQ